MGIISEVLIIMIHGVTHVTSRVDLEGEYPTNTVLQPSTGTFVMIIIHKYEVS